MRRTRLALVAADLAQQVEGAGLSRCRAAAIAAARFAVAHSGLEDKRASEALEAAVDGRFGDTPERTAIDELVATLDERQWDLQDRVEAGEASDEEQLVAFRRARAASAVSFAGESDARVAAAEALYEASFVVDDPGELWTTVGPLLS